MCGHPARADPARRTAPTGRSTCMAAHTFDDADAAPSEQPVSGWAVGGIGFAASILTLVGGFQVVTGLAAIIDDQFYVVTRNYAFDLDVSTWGWIHLVLGVLL